MTAPGMPSEEEIAEAILNTGINIGGSTWPDEHRRDAGEIARAILALIRPAFEAKEREIDTYRTCADANEGDRRGAEQEIARLKAKLAQAVEALRPFAEAAEEIDLRDKPKLDLHNIPPGLVFVRDLRRARAAAAMGEKT